uniref:Uncharacterized protein n=1 Tax=Arundo donax TaxID=35708 RepID=A0A0A9C4M4_ARUDO
MRGSGMIEVRLGLIEGNITRYTHFPSRRIITVITLMLRAIA